MEYLCFKNPGVIDPVMFKTFGVSAKEGDNPIGFFGTGLKYAIAIVLREKGEFILYSGNDRYEFGVKTVTLRGKEFQLVTCNGEDLGFTTDLGKTWEVWMAYRELYSNCVDEKGYLSMASKLIGWAGETRIFINCPAMMDVHRKKETVFLSPSRTPLFVSDRAEVLDGPSDTLFYRGIKVATLNRPGCFTYNILDKIDLTEDRTVKYQWEVDTAISCTLAQMSETSAIRKFFNAEDTAYEKGLGFSSSAPYSKEFLTVARECYRSDPSKVPHTLHTHIHKVEPGTMFENLTLSAIEQKKLDAAIEFCAKIGFDSGAYRLTVVETLGPSILAMARRDEQQIVLSRRVFHQGLKQLCSTIIEEVIHLREGLSDCTRAMQTYLFDYIASMGEQITGENL